MGAIISRPLTYNRHWKLSMNKLLVCTLLCGAFLAKSAEVTIPIDKFELKNGLRVILSQDNAAPVVAVYMIYDVGSRAEEKGRTGFAHLFEHMMFEGSANVPKGMHFATIESNGGVMNGSTHPDYTDYFEVLPSNKLATALWLESDRMRSLAINEENLKNQKEAVKQERRLSFDNQPYATAIVDVWPTLMFKNWQSSHSLIGSFEDLNASTVEDVTKFFKTLLRAGQRGAGDRRRHPGSRSEETGGDVLRRYPVAAAAEAARPGRARAISTAETKVYKDPLAQVPGVIIGYPGPEAPFAGLLRAEHDRRDPHARRQLMAAAGPGQREAVGDPVRGESRLAVRQHARLP